jgi:menaquinone-dependent protoporphyrinogen oxidase
VKAGPGRGDAGAPAYGAQEEDVMDDATPDAREEPRSGPQGATVGAPGRVLVVFATRHGSTPEVAEAVAEELRAGGAEVDVRPAGLGGDLSRYSAVIVGAPMILGWHKDALRFIARHRAQLASMKTAYFVTAASLTETGEERIDGIPIVKDPWLAKPPKDPGRLSFRERYARPAKYLGKPLRKAPDVRPSSVAFLAGSLDLTKMNILEKAFVLLIVAATPGDSRNWEAIRAWARGLVPLLS